MCRTTFALPNCGCPAYPVAPWLLVCNRAVKNAKVVEYMSNAEVVKDARKVKVVECTSNAKAIEDRSKAKKWKCIFPDTKKNPKSRVKVTNQPCDLCQHLDVKADERAGRDLRRQGLMLRGKTDLAKRAAGRFEDVATIEPALLFQRAKQSRRVLDNLKKKYGFKIATKYEPGTDERTFAQEVTALHEEAVAWREKLYEREENQAQAEREARIAALEKGLEAEVAKLSDDVQKQGCRVM